jgi:CRP-like cAMP-binding protein
MRDVLAKNISKHIQLEPDEFDYFASLLKTKRLRKKQFLLEEGEVCRFECFVSSGCLRQYYLDDKGDEYIIQFAITDWWISDQYSFLNGLPSQCFIDALEDSEVLLIEKQILEELYVKIPKFERFFRIAFQNSYVALQRRILANISQTAEERYRNFSQQYPEIAQKVPQRQIASYLGIKPESLSRLRRQLPGN